MNFTNRVNVNLYYDEKNEECSHCYVIMQYNKDNTFKNLPIM